MNIKAIFIITALFAIIPTSVIAKKMTDDEILALEKNLNYDREFAIKAALMRYIGTHITWPAVNVPERLYNVCIMTDKVSRKGLNIIHGKKSRKKSISVIYDTTLGDLATPQNCHLAFFDEQAPSFYKQINDITKGKGVLTLANNPGFAEANGLMNFAVINNKIALQINTKRFAEENFEISNKLFKFVTIIPKLKKGENPNIGASNDESNQ